MLDVGPISGEGDLEVDMLDTDPRRCRCERASTVWSWGDDEGKTMQVWQHEALRIVLSLASRGTWNPGNESLWDDAHWQTTRRRLKGVEKCIRPRGGRRGVCMYVYVCMCVYSWVGG